MQRNCFSILRLKNLKEMAPKTWRTVDNALNRKARRTNPEVSSIDHHLCTTKPKMADKFSNYFATIRVNKLIPDIPTPYIHYLNNATESTFNFKVIDNAIQRCIIYPKLQIHDNINSYTLK